MIFAKTINNMIMKLAKIRRQAGTGTWKYISRAQRLFIGDKSDILPPNRGVLHSKHTQISSLGNEKLKGLTFVLNAFSDSFALFYKSANRLMHVIPVMNPNNRTYMLFEVLSALLIAFILIITSVSLCFKVSPIEVLPLGNWEKNKLMYQILMFLSCFVFSADIFCSFFTSYYDAGELIKRRSQIKKNYIKTNFLWDLISCIPVYNNVIALLFQDYSSDYKAPFFVDALFFFKFKDLVGSFEKVNELISIRENFEIVFSLIKLGLQILLISHTAACLWYFMSSGESGTWITSKQIENENLKMKYIYSLYWALTTLATVGYGDITPQNPKEMIFALGVMLIGSALFGYSLNKIGNLLESVNKKDNELKKKLKVIDWYMNEKNIDLDLQKRVRKYLEFKIKNENSYLFLAEELLSKNLSGNLKEEFLEECNNKILKAFPVITENFSHLTIKKLSSCVKTLNFRPEEIIEKRGEIKEPALYFVYKGNLGLKFDGNGEKKRQLGLLKKGDTFGELSFFTDKAPNISLITNSSTTLLAIEKKDFLYLIRESRKDYEKFCEIRDRLFMSQENTILRKTCFICSAQDHGLTKCPQVFLRPKNLIQKHQYWHRQKRMKWKRVQYSQKKLKLPGQIIPTYRKLHSLKIHRYLEHSINEFIKLKGEAYFSKNDENNLCSSSRSLLESGGVDDFKSQDLAQPVETDVKPPPKNNTKFIKQLKREVSPVSSLDLTNGKEQPMGRKSEVCEDSSEPTSVFDYVNRFKSDMINSENSLESNRVSSSSLDKESKRFSIGGNLFKGVVEGSLLNISAEKEINVIASSSYKCHNTVFTNFDNHIDSGNPGDTVDKCLILLTDMDKSEDCINYFPHFNKKVVIGLIGQKKRKK